MDNIDRDFLIMTKQAIKNEVPIIAIIGKPNAYRIYNNDGSLADYVLLLLAVISKIAVKAVPDDKQKQAENEIANVLVKTLNEKMEKFQNDK